MATMGGPICTAFVLVARLVTSPRPQGVILSLHRKRAIDHAFLRHRRTVLPSLPAPHDILFYQLYESLNIGYKTALLK